MPYLHVLEKRAGFLMEVPADQSLTLLSLETKNVVCSVLVFLAEFLVVFAVKSLPVCFCFADAT